MNDPRDYYRILHVHPDAPTEIIRSSYRTLMQRLKRHPDLGGDHEDAALINEAYATLTDPIRRAEYDQGRRQTIPPDVSENQSSAAPGSAHHTYRTTGNGYCEFCRAAHDFGSNTPESALCDNCGSPLHRVERQQHPTSGLRSVDRLPKEQLIRFYTEWPDGATNSGRTRDISLDGMQFETTLPLAVNQLLKIDCDVCRAVARVAHVRQGTDGWIVGVQFVTLRFENSQGTFVSAEA